MNLLELLKKEVNNLNLSNQKEIAYYLYIRTGEIFDFDARWDYGNESVADEVLEKELDMENITDFHLVCKSWSKLYVNLLKEFGISAKVVGKNNHFKVEIILDNKEYIADLTNKYEDIFRIKFGLKVLHFHLKGESFINEDLDNKIKYLKGIKTEEVLANLYREIDLLDLTHNDYILKVCDLIMNIINFPRKYVDFVSGKEYILYLFERFGLNVSTNTFCQIDRNIFVGVFRVRSYQNVYYFSYQKVNDVYVMNKISEEELIEIIDRFQKPDEYVLKLNK